MREKRYHFFKKVAATVGAKVVATGHTMDDQAETVIMRVIKGTTIKGLGGIMPVGTHGPLKVIRPLIEIEKSQILASLKRGRFSYCKDHTNDQMHYFRNRVRKSIIPYLERYNPRLKRSISLMAESLREDRAFIEDEKDKRKRISKNGAFISIELKDLVVQPKALQREILRDAIIKTGASVKKLTYRHWKDLDNFLRFKRRGKSLDLPGRVIIKRLDKKIVLHIR